MACSIQFVRLDDFISDIDVLDLSTNGYSLAQDGYFQTAAPDDVKSVHEVITLKLQGSSKDDLAAMTQEIDEKIKQVGWWLRNPGVERYQVWIRVQLENESLPRQAQILSILPPDKVRTFTPEERIDNYIGSYSISFERIPFWEDVYPYPNTSTITPVRNLGNIVGTFAQTISGDVPARLARFTYTNEPAEAYTAAWFGIKSSRFGNPANFVPHWDLTDAYTFGTDTAVSGSDVVCDFSTVSTLVNRVIILVSSVTANYADQRGNYSVLLCAKMSDTSVARLRMSYGSGVADVTYNPIYRSRQAVQGTDYSIYELGTISIPAAPVLASDTLANFAIGIDAELISGTGSLAMNSLTLMPTEALIKISTPSAATPMQSDPISVYQKPDGRLVSYEVVAGDISKTLLTQPLDWGLPANDDNPVVVFCAQYSGASSLPDSNQGSITFAYIPRWRTLRGNET